MIQVHRPYQFILVVFLVAASIIYLQSQGPGGLGAGEQVVLENRTNLSADRTARIMEKADRFERAREITNPSGFINTDNVSISELVGEKVILLDMWTYTCINCQRTFPYLTAWHEKYKDHGLVIIGNHAPEFAFEKKRANVQDAVDRFGIEYPVVLDNNYGTWRAYNNRYWPQKYVIGIDGFVRYEHIGEGSYAETERKIQELLRERNRVLGIETDVPTGTVNPDAERPNVLGIGTPEIYFGAWRNGALANGQSNTIGLQRLGEPTTIEQNKLYLTGYWNIRREYAEAAKANASIILQYRAKTVNMVARANAPTRLNITLDGEPLDTAAGRDVERTGAGSTVTVREDRLYNVVADDAYGVHTLRITSLDPGLEAFTFTFG